MKTFGAHGKRWRKTFEHIETPDGLKLIKGKVFSGFCWFKLEIMSNEMLPENVF